MFRQLVNKQDEFDRDKDVGQRPRTGPRDLQLFSDLMVVSMIDLRTSSQSKPTHFFPRLF